MKHASFAYPAGSAGLALLLLRAAVALSLLGLSLKRPPQEWLPVALYVLAALIGLGSYTRTAAGMAMGVSAVIALRGGSTVVLPLVAHALAAAALAGLGPGAFSVDGRRFGRRVVRLQDRDRTEG